jgi:rhodanese-related sulfurtransferase
MFQFISGAEARALIENDNAQLVDVRTVEEYQRGAATGARNIPLHVLPHVALEHLDLGKPVIVYCMSGGRSAQAQMILQRMGFDTVHNVGSIHNFVNS